MPRWPGARRRPAQLHALDFAITKRLNILARRRTSRVDNWSDWHSRCVSDLAPVNLADGRGLLLPRSVLLAALRHHPAASHRAGAGARRRADDAGPLAHRHERSRQRGAYRAHFASDRADQQSRQRDGAGNAELYSR
jgi:hypothetical protein